jgi:opacity protein-like surface antigen
MTRVARSSVFSAAAAVASCVLLFPAKGVAEDTMPPTRVDFTLFGGYRTGGNLEQTIGTTAEGVPIKLDASFDKGTSYGLALNWEAEADSFYELIYTRQGTTLDATTPIDVTVEYLQIGGYVTAAEKAAKVMPYFVLVAGIGRLVPDDDDLRATTKFSAAIGGGVKWSFTEHIAMRFDARLYAMFLGNESNLMCGGSGGVTCKIQLKGDVLVQPDVSLGFTYGF